MYWLPGLQLAHDSGAYVRTYVHHSSAHIRTPIDIRISVLVAKHSLIISHTDVRVFYPLVSFT